jgi:ATP-dependent Clp protease ATP-binding subunit ClpA
MPERPDAILYVQGLFDLAAKGPGWSVPEAVRVLEPRLSQGVQCIASGTPFGLRRTTERVESLARHFEVIPVLPPTEEEAIRMLAGVKDQYEKFHGVAITNEAIETSVCRLALVSETPSSAGSCDRSDRRRGSLRQAAA